MTDSIHNYESQYEPMSEADFDHPPVGPVGVHRGRRSWVARFVPFISVIILAIIIGLLTWSVLTGEISQVHWPWQQNVSVSSQSQEVASSQSADNSTKKTDSSANSGAVANTNSQKTDNSNKTDDKTNTNTDEKTVDKTHDADKTDQKSSDTANTADANTDNTVINKATAIKVVNATRITGHAGQKAAMLKNAGYTQVVATNPRGSVPRETVIWYQNETDKSTAEDVARILGITNVQKATDISTPIVVVLLK